MDSRFVTLAKRIVTFSVNVQSKEKVYIEADIHAIPLLYALMQEVYAAGGYPFYKITDLSVEQMFVSGASNEQLKIWEQQEISRQADIDVFIAIRGTSNLYEMVLLPEKKKEAYALSSGRISHARTSHRSPLKWCTLQCPSPSLAQQMRMPTWEFEDYFCKICAMDYSDMRRRAQPLVDIFAKTDHVHIIGPDTDLEFSIKGQVSAGSTPCIGYFNLPDGEAASNVVVESVNGQIRYNLPSFYDGFRFENVAFEFRNGVIVNASANDTERLHRILNRDKGARRIGEFAIGLNPYIGVPTGNILFDEKKFGTFHFTPGNGPLNSSLVHWDLLQCQLPEYGGGEIWFDNVLLQKDGTFVPQELRQLNPDAYAAL